MRIDAHVHFLVYNPREHLWVTEGSQTNWVP
jgi:hypothetical protein